MTNYGDTYKGAAVDVDMLEDRLKRANNGQPIAYKQPVSELRKVKDTMKKTKECKDCKSKDISIEQLTYSLRLAENTAKDAVRDKSRAYQDQQFMLSQLMITGRPFISTMRSIGIVI